jgi:TolA-binding protein
MGRSDEAIRRLQQLAKRWPGNRDLLFALATMQRDAGQRAAARATAESLAAAFPDDRNAQALVEELSKPAAPAPPQSN